MDKSKQRTSWASQPLLLLQILLHIPLGMLTHMGLCKLVDFFFFIAWFILTFFSIQARTKSCPWVMWIISPSSSPFHSGRGDEALSPSPLSVYKSSEKKNHLQLIKELWHSEIKNNHLLSNQLWDNFLGTSKSFLFFTVPLPLFIQWSLFRIQSPSESWDSNNLLYLLPFNLVKLCFGPFNHAKMYITNKHLSFFQFPVIFVINGIQTFIWL